MPRSRASSTPYAPSATTMFNRLSHLAPVLVLQNARAPMHQLSAKSPSASAFFKVCCPARLSVVSRYARGRRRRH
eukprot:2998250-Pleurochrysis_carterae.AAC.1